MSISDYPRRSLSDADDSQSAVHSEYCSSSRSQYGLDGREFVHKHGSRHHAYDPENAPWPLSYDKATLEK